jgi:hypothetical protein
MSKLSEAASYAKLMPTQIRQEIVQADMAIARARFLIEGCKLHSDDYWSYARVIESKRNFLAIAKRALAAHNQDGTRKT